jgi:hypothetical protein
MASARPPSPGLHIDVGLSVDEVEEKPATADNYQGLDPAIKRALHVYLWDTASVFACASSFILMFYMREEFHKTGKYGYAWQNFFEGVISIAAVYPFALKSRFMNGENHREAMRKMMKAIPVYLPLNALFQPTKDWVAAISQGRSLTDIDFQEYANAAYDPIEALGALAAYGVGFSLTYYGLAKLMGVPATLLDTAKTGSQYYLSYLMGALFNTDLSVGVSRLPNVFYSSLTLSGLNFAFDVLTNKEIMMALKTHHVMRRQQSLANLETLANTSEPTLDAKSEAVNGESRPDENREPFLSVAEQLAADDDSPKRGARCKKSCYEILASYCFFGKKSQKKPPQPTPILSAPVHSMGSAAR